MAMKVSALCIISLLTIISSDQSHASFPSSPLDSDSICETTPHAYYCKYILPSNKLNTIFDYGNISIHQSLSNARSFLASVKHFLAFPSKSMSQRTIRALEDCQFLADQNVDFLSRVSERINSKDSLNSFVADDLHASLSAALVNVETCFQGLEATPLGPSIKDRLFQSNGTKSISVSLAVFRHWDHGSTISRRNLFFPNLIHERNSPLSLLVSTDKQAIYEFATGKNDSNTLTYGKISVPQVVVVSPKGDGHFTTINDAIAAAPHNAGESDQYFGIYVVSGVYKEYISVPKNKQNLILIGDGMGRTIITGSRSAADGFTTFNTATFAVAGTKFIAVDITFQNTAGPSKGQAVAVRNGADMSVFYRCSFEGYQDTLYAHSYRQFYRECDIYGTVDFIFGNAAVVFENCNIYPRLPLPHQHNIITAQGRTDPNQETGISIDNCVIKAADDLASSRGAKKTYLGRPWKKYSRTVYVQSFMDSLIEPEGWIEWKGDFDTTIYYAEYRNNGPGSSTDYRVNWPGYHKDINNTEADKFTVSNFINGDKWLPATGVPFNRSFH
ncbi:putative Pectinesterase PPE8B precursor [Hibiscus syriacus]|uniref:Pectinesterase n=1 Tax=Hibiscus syriacus TaxID=106335 RepID=A0A6A3B6X1_HIBSY|nr:pectinesterase-like [Hibiscus syriacus]KAE8711538.1 putative Pectinesterase PPE8B precursor [Hibiscus syriacus]